MKKKILLIEPFSGISGDMFISACYDLGLPMKYLKNIFNQINIPQLNFKFINTKKNYINCKKLIIKCKKNKHHLSYNQIKNIIEKSKLNNFIKENSLKILKNIAKAEAKIHKTNLENIHFHELGGYDTIFDLVAGAAAIDYFKFDKIYNLPINLGSGSIKTMHGIMPVPAPAALELLKNNKVYFSNINFELTTPTGAGILNNFSSPFESNQIFMPEKIGYGAGTIDFGNNNLPNLLRINIIHTESQINNYIYEIKTNIDDCSSEILGFAFEELFNNNALDVFFTPVIMKKNRQGTLLTVLCEEKNFSKILNTIFNNIPTAGIRYNKTNRIILQRKIEKIKTKYGIVRFKIFNEFKIPEYDDCKKIAKKLKIPIIKIMQELQNLK